MVVGGYRSHGPGFTVGAPFLGADSFGHFGAAGSSTSAEPRSGPAPGRTRRTPLRPTAAGPDAQWFAVAVHRCAPALGGAPAGPATRRRESIS
ncbi:hypothetical protein GCM10027160_47620 [Streptomyces calidiresistens]